MEEIVSQIKFPEPPGILPDYSLPKPDPEPPGILPDYSLPKPDLEIPLSRLDLSYSFGGQTHISSKERTNLYLTTTIPVFIAFTILYVVISRFFPLQDTPWLWWIGIFLASRLADIISTFIALGMGGTELNPASDPHDITSMLPLQIVQICVIIGISFLLGFIGPWWKIGFLFALSLTGFEACFANMGQTLSGPTVVSHGTNPTAAMSGKLYSSHVVSVILIGVITSVVLWFIFR